MKIGTLVCLLAAMGLPSLMTNTRRVHAQTQAIEGTGSGQLIGRMAELRRPGRHMGRQTGRQR